LDLSEDGGWIIPVLNLKAESDLQNILADWDFWLQPIDDRSLQALVTKLLMIYPIKKDAETKPLSNIIDLSCKALKDLPEWAVREGLNEANKKCKFRPTPAELREFCEEAAKVDLKIRNRLRIILSNAPRREDAGEISRQESKSYKQLSAQERADFDAMMKTVYANLKSSRPQTQKPKLKLKQQLPDGRWMENPTLEDIQNAKEEIAGVAAE